MWLNNRYGGIEDLADYRICRVIDDAQKYSALSLPWTSISIAPGISRHYQDDKTKKITVQASLPGKARIPTPALFQQHLGNPGYYGSKQEYLIA